MVRNEEVGTAVYHQSMDKEVLGMGLVNVSRLAAKMDSKEVASLAEFLYGGDSANEWLRHSVTIRGAEAFGRVLEARGL